MELYTITIEFLIDDESYVLSFTDINKATSFCKLLKRAFGKSLKKATLAPRGIELYIPQTYQDIIANA